MQGSGGYNGTNNYPIIEPLQIFFLDLLDFLKSGDRQIPETSVLELEGEKMTVRETSLTGPVLVSFQNLL